MPPLIPLVEVAHYADHFGVRRPHGESYAPHAQALHNMRAHRAIALVLRALTVNVEIEIGDQARKSVRVLDFDVSRSTA